VTTPGEFAVGPDQLDQLARDVEGVATGVDAVVGILQGNRGAATKGFPNAATSQLCDQMWAWLEQRTRARADALRAMGSDLATAARQYRDADTSGAGLVTGPR
jgi:hypothetical protein